MSESLSWHQYVFGKLVKYPDGPILGPDHDCIGKSEGFPEELERYCRYDRVGLGSGDVFEWHEYPWLNRGGGIVCRPHIIDDKAYVIVGRMQMRSEDGGPAKPPFRLYHHRHYIITDAKRVLYPPVVMSTDIPWMEPMVEKEMALKPVTTSYKHLDKRLPDEWIEEISEPLKIVMSGQSLSVQDWAMEVDNFLSTVNLVLCALPLTLVWRIPFGAGLTNMDGSVAIGMGMWALKGARIIKGERKDTEEHDFSDGEYYYGWIEENCSGCSTYRELVDTVAEKLPKFESYDSIPIGLSWKEVSKQISGVVSKLERIKEFRKSSDINVPEERVTGIVNVLDDLFATVREYNPWYDLISTGGKANWLREWLKDAELELIWFSLLEIVDKKTQRFFNSLPEGKYQKIVKRLLSGEKSDDNELIKFIRCATKDNLDNLNLLIGKANIFDSYLMAEESRRRGLHTKLEILINRKYSDTASSLDLIKESKRLAAQLVKLNKLPTKTMCRILLLGWEEIDQREKDEISHKIESLIGQPYTYIITGFEREDLRGGDHRRVFSEVGISAIREKISIDPEVSQRLFMTIKRRYSKGSFANVISRELFDIFKFWLCNAKKADIRWMKDESLILLSDILNGEKVDIKGYLGEEIDTGFVRKVLESFESKIEIKNFVVKNVSELEFLEEIMPSHCELTLSDSQIGLMIDEAFVDESNLKKYKGITSRRRDLLDKPGWRLLSLPEHNKIKIGLYDTESDSLKYLNAFSILMLVLRGVDMPRGDLNKITPEIIGDFFERDEWSKYFYIKHLHFFSKEAKRKKADRFGEALLTSRLGFAKGALSRSEVENVVMKELKRSIWTRDLFFSNILDINYHREFIANISWTVGRETIIETFKDINFVDVFREPEYCLLEKQRGSAMKKCPDCGRRVREANSIFCPDCSTRLVSVTAEDILESQLRELIKEKGYSILDDRNCEKLISNLEYKFFLEEEDKNDYWRKKKFLIKALKGNFPQEILSLRDEHTADEIIETLKDKLLVYQKNLSKDSAYWVIATWIYAFKEDDNGKGPNGDTEGYLSIEKNKDRNEMHPKHGFVGKSVYIIFEPQLNDAKCFSEGLAAVKVKKKWGYVNKDGEAVIESKYDKANDFSEGIAAVYIGGKWQYINKKGEPIVDSLFNDASSFSEGVAGVDMKEKICYVDKSFKIVATPHVDHNWEGWGRSFSEGMCMVAKGKNLGYIDKEGFFCIEPNYREAGDFSNGLAPVVPSKFPIKIWGYINNVGKYIIWARFFGARNFSERLAAVKSIRNIKWGYIDDRGKFVIKPSFKDALDFSEGLAAVRHSGGKYSGKWGFIDKSGKYVIDPRFITVRNFSEGLAPVMIEGKWGYISHPLKVDSYRDGSV
ncbi:MAG: WG repeat-containing protein [Deltaproteobacteria bacterium]|uniref:WG repeat-containing protein n=1 Tax=Candidatus Zymogenus saltonus TaxID=2844893 RepID=A0A9D8KE18_9DELT|nr:WG repeat-containing protein [Candidatus Zymogenus saltonus]